MYIHVYMFVYFNDQIFCVFIYFQCYDAAVFFLLCLESWSCVYLQVLCVSGHGSGEDPLSVSHSLPLVHLTIFLSLFICCFPFLPLSFLLPIHVHTCFLLHLGSNQTSQSDRITYVLNPIYMMWFGRIWSMNNYKIAWSYIAYDVSYRIELFSIPCDATKSYVAKS